MMSSPTSAKENVKRRKTSAETATSATIDTTRRVICGGLAGMIAKTAFAPLDRIRILVQTGEHGLAASKEHQRSIIVMYKSIIEREGVVGLWAGNGANILRIFPSKGVVFTSNDFWRNQIRLINGAPTSEEPLSGAMSFIAGGLSGMTATAATYPLDLIRGRISGKLAIKERHYHGILNTLKVTVTDEGFRALYKGMTPSLLGAVPYEGIKFGTVGLLEKLFPINKDNSNNPIVLRKVCFGAMGGLMAGLIMYPNDTIRRMIQLQGSRGTTEVYSGYWDCVRQTYSKHGITRFYYGVTINLIRMVPNTALQFGCYELLKKYTKDWTF